MEVWENEKYCGNTSRRRVFPQVFGVLPNFHELFHETECIMSNFYLETITVANITSTLTKKHKVITYFVKHFNVSWREITGPSEKFTISSRISGGEGVGSATPGRRILVERSVIRYVDIRPVTKAGAVIGLLVHCILLILILSQLHRVISFDIVEREDESFTSWSVTART